MPRTQKGQRFGGRTKGTPNKATVERALIAQRQIEEARAAGKKLGKEVLEEFMMTFAGMAATHQPLPPGTINTDPRREPDQSLFQTYARLAVETAGKLAEFQSPKFRAIVVGMPGEERRPPQIEAAPNEHGNTAASRAQATYLRLVKGD